MEELKKFSTAQLVEELYSRENVEGYFTELYNTDNDPRNIRGLEIHESSSFGIQKKITLTNCDILLIGHDRENPDDDIIIKNLVRN